MAAMADAAIAALKGQKEMWTPNVNSGTWKVQRPDAAKHL